VQQTTISGGPFRLANKWLNNAKVIRKLLTNLGLLTRAVPHSSLKEGPRFSSRNMQRLDELPRAIGLK